jgi:hypothetical protein
MMAVQSQFEQTVRETLSQKKKKKKKTTKNGLVEWLKAPVPQKKKKKIKWPRKLDKTVLQLKRTLIRFFVFVLLVVWFDGDSLSQWPLNS